jgi:uncharacterized membrane protein YcaP (DUF421 family)
MDAVLRATAMYLMLLVVFRVSGRRMLAELTTFDFVLLLIIGEATQQALLGADFSFINAMLVIVTLVTLEIVLSLLKVWVPFLGKLLDGTPMIVVDHGRPLRERMHKARIDEEDILEAARRLQGIERLDQIKYAVLEVSGGITVIPNDRH